MSWDIFVQDILATLNLRAFDPQSETGIFDPLTAEASRHRWRAYRDAIVRGQAGA